MNKKQMKNNAAKTCLSINKLISKKDIALGIFITAILYSFYILSVTTASYLYQNADLYKLSLFASGVSPYSILPWQAPYPPLYFILWIMPYLLITSLLHNPAQIYLGFKAFSLIIIYFVTFLVYKSLTSLKVNKYKSIFLSAIFLIFAQDTLRILTGDSLGILLLAFGTYLFIKRKNFLGVLFVTMAVLFKIHPIIGLILIIVALLRNSKRDFYKSISIVIAAIIIFFIIPMAVISNSFSSFIGFESNALQFYTFNIYSGIFGLLSSTLSLTNPLTSSLATLIDEVWIVTTMAAIILLSFSILKKEKFKNAKLTDILAIGLLVWLLLLKQTLPYYYIWPLAVLISGNRIKSAAFLIIGNLLGSVLFYYAISLLGSTSTISYALPPPVNVSLCFLVGGILFAIFDILAIRQIIVEIDTDNFGRQ